MAGARRFVERGEGAASPALRRDQFDQVFTPAQVYRSAVGSGVLMAMSGIIRSA